VAQEPPAAPNFTISGVVKSGNLPIPGATIIATDASGQKVATWSDADGSYTLQVPAAGKYTLGGEMAAFAPVIREIEVKDASTRAA